MSDPTTERAETTDAGATGAAQTGAATQAATEPEAKFTQEDVNRLLAEEKRKLKQQQTEAADKARREAEEKAALEKGEFEKLATQRGSELAQTKATLEAATARIEAYEAVLERQIKARVKSLPEKVRGKLPDGDTLTRHAWLEMVEELAGEVGVGRTGAPDINAGARSGAGRTPQDVISAEAERLRQSGRYGGF
jgi:flagellar biosynthesis/type III secretory pathway protein FliH